MHLVVLHCDNHVLAVHKPAGMACVPDASGDPSLLDLARAWVRKTFAKPGEAFLAVVHRLDRPVAGVVLFARTSKGARRLAEQWRSRAARKVYWAVGEGRPPAAAGEHRVWLLKDERANRVREAPAGQAGAKEAITRWRVLRAAEGRTLYELVPVTGRSHQLRACAAALGTPLVGDVKYGARERTADGSVALLAREVAVAHPTRAEEIRCVSPLPDDPVWDLARPSGG